MLDPRGPRFAALLSTVVLVAVLVTGSGWLALAQAVVFAATAASPRWGPYGLVYRGLVAPRLGPPGELEPAAPVRFAQMVGLGFTLVAAAGYFTGFVGVGMAATATALVAAFLNAGFGLCLGCETYLLIRRLSHRPRPARVPTSEGVEA